jgi:hypothetical protein
MLEDELEEMEKREEITHQLRKIFRKISFGQALTNEEKELFKEIEMWIQIIKSFKGG